MNRQEYLDAKMRGLDINESEWQMWQVRIAETPDVRSDLVQRVRQDISRGMYDGSLLLETALDRMLDEYDADWD